MGFGEEGNVSGSNSRNPQHSPQKEEEKRRPRAGAGFEKEFFSFFSPLTEKERKEEESKSGEAWKSNSSSFAGPLKR